MTHVTWKIDEALDLPLAIIEDTPDGTGVCEMCQRNETTLANADFIVRACNSHAELLEACEKLAAWDRSDGDVTLISEACSMARQAIAHATQS